MFLSPDWAHGRCAISSEHESLPAPIPRLVLNHKHVVSELPSLSPQVKLYSNDVTKHGLSSFPALPDSILHTIHRSGDNFSGPACKAVIIDRSHLHD
jgi:hypothetical protein